MSIIKLIMTVIMLFWQLSGWVVTVGMGLLSVCP